MKTQPPKFVDKAHKALCERISAYCKKFFLQESRFGILAMKDPNLVDDIRRGRKLRPRSVAQIELMLKRRPPDKWGAPVTLPSDNSGSGGAGALIES